MPSPVRLLLAVLATAPTLVGAADTVGVLPVAAPPGPAPELVESTGELRKAIAERSPEVLDAQQVRDRMTGQAQGATVPELEQAFVRARSLSVAGDYDGSVRTLRSILDELARLPDGDDNFALWQRAMLRLARSEQDLNHRDTARGLLDELFRVAPQAPFDPSQSSARFTQLVEEVRAQVRKLPQYKLTVTSPTPDTRIFVSGRDVGVAPRTVSMARGKYRVSGAAGNFRSPSSAVTLTEGDATVALDFSVAESLRPGLGPGLALPEGDRTGAIVAAGEFLRLDSVVATSYLTEAGASFLSGSLYDVRRKELTREGRVRLTNKALPSGWAPALGDYLMTGQVTSTLVEGPGVAAARADLRTPTPGEGKPDLQLSSAEAGPRKTSALGWMAFGTGIATVALAGVSVWQVIEMNSNQSAACALNACAVPPDNQKAQLYYQYQDAAASAKTTAIITGAAAGACLVGTVVMAVIAKEIGPIRF
jgi:hypothetical protein